MPEDTVSFVGQKNRDTDNNKVNPNSPLTDEYYDKVEEVLKEGGNL